MTSVAMMICRWLTWAAGWEVRSKVLLCGAAVAVLAGCVVDSEILDHYSLRGASINIYTYNKCLIILQNSYPMAYAIYYHFTAS